MSKYERITAALFGEVWAITPNKLQAIVDVVSSRVADTDGTNDFISIPKIEFQGYSDVSASSGELFQRAGNAAVIPVMGTIAQRMSLLTASSGGVSTESIGRKVEAAANQSNIDQIVLHIDSPGGSVFGVQELADKVFQARQKKPVIAVADSLAASAAYWIGSQASEFVVTPGGEVGSIGVIAMHLDRSEANEKAGIKPTFIFAGEHKADGNMEEPLSDSALSRMQYRVDERYNVFIDAVARGRSVDSGTVRETFGKGQVITAKEALSLGMVDRVATIDTVIKELGSGRSNAARNAVARMSLMHAEIMS